MLERGVRGGLDAHAAGAPYPSGMDPATQPGRTLTLREALEAGGRPLGWFMGTAGVLMWLVWKDPAPAWNAVRLGATAVIALAWLVPTFAVPVPSAARAWRWAAACAAAACLLLR